ncbi:MAG: 50S ribosomal protein L22 [Candidatus Magasanikbacteria bacterium CG10_big_fil_rev_8_21_14_0_10_43_6]|uniref:Large ribosomal subunit protein uL22 n=1 Tax=Candidatus Magasanikbacteria bacterium CG10_big_fil_rev_8_21_14_0_10_43_6 TaxID=1974650 RepID=A0A2M6W053_9BACT|nr:MAG: 50S ribosomal protein L22 [Candidatus Magasanikbacteria bacterium CG10_big_fil_rev_8_21_14_0_10_43_6]
MQTTAKLNKLHIAPRKVRLLIDMVRGKHVEEAILQLKLSKKSAAIPLRKLLESAVANAKHNHKIEKETLIVKTAFVDGGVTLKRWMPRAFGRATPIRKRSSHITVILEGDVAEAAPKVAKKEDVVAKVAPKKETKK